MDTIAALATPPGAGGIGIVRISGKKTRELAEALLGAPPRARRAAYRPFLDADGRVIDTGVALYFPAPHSYTGEDVLELQGHGGMVVMNMLLQRVLSLGTRLARPGEFTERAFLNGKIDLAQAEAVADLINSSTEQAVRSAQRSLQGLFSDRVRDLVQHLIELRLFVEASIDFADEDIDFLSAGETGRKLQNLTGQLEDLRCSARQGCLLRDGMTVVIAGPPNAGKSSLLNCLAGREAAIVTEIEGTTRDVLRERIQIDGMPLHIVDTAGLRPSRDRIEQEGVKRAQREIQNADRILLVLDDSRPERHIQHDLPASFPPRIGITRIYNKIDLTGRAPCISENADGVEIALSVKTGGGLEHLYAHLKSCIGYGGENEDVFIARTRHLSALEEARESLESGLRQMREAGAPELVAEDLRKAQDALSRITGEFTSDDLLGRIFADFCIGK